MEGLAITNSGIEDVAAKEIKEIIGPKTKCKTGKGFVIFDFKKFEDLFLLCYRSQSLKKVMFILDKFKFKSVGDIKQEVSHVELKEWPGSFVVNCTGLGASHQEVREDVGEAIKKKIKGKISFKEPDTVFFAYLDKDDCYFCIDFGSEDLAKREYRIFLSRDSIKASLAYALARLCKFNKKKVLLDPFCNDGVVVIESALFATNFSHHHYNKDMFRFLGLKRFESFDFDKFFEKADKKTDTSQKTDINAFEDNFRLLQSSKKNAKIAGIMKSIRFSRTEPDWIELKFKEKSIDVIAAQPPQKHHFTEPAKLQRTYDELFLQAGYVLKEKGFVGLITKPNVADMLKKAAEKHKFKLKEERKVMQGKQEMEILLFSKLTQNKVL
jgi:23S rRNA G2445 N2-methylase RlmL